MPIPGWLELLVILVIVLILFGPGRISKLAGELGKGILSFRKGLDGDRKEVSQSKKRGTY